MGYVEGSLAKDETIKVRAKYHWIAWLEFYFVFFTLGAASILIFLLAAQMDVDQEIDVAVATIEVGCLFAAVPLYH